MFSNPLSIFVMLVAVLIAFLVDVFDPFSNLGTQLRGKSGEDFDKAVYVYGPDGKKLLDEDDDPKINWQNIKSKAGGWCLGACLYLAVGLPLSLLVTYLVEPIYFIGAITGNVGNVYVTYLMLGIILITGIYLVSGIAKVIQAAFKKNEPEIVPGPDATPAERTAYEVRKSMKEEEARKKVLITNADLAKSTFRRIFFALPDIYLAYLLILALWPKQ